METQDKYKLFFDWFKANGGKYSEDLIQYPAYFQPGNYTGVLAKADIPARQVIMATPFNIIITSSKGRSELPGLADEIIKNESIPQKVSFYLQTLFLVSEIQKGKDAFFYPYINLVSPDSFL